MIHCKFDIEIDENIVQEIDLNSSSYQRYKLIYTSNIVKCIRYRIRE